MKTIEQLEHEVEILRQTLGTLITWLASELGHDNAVTLLKDINPKDG